MTRFYIKGINKYTMHNVEQYVALVPAGGVGKRFGAPLPKQYAQIAGVSLLQYAVKALLADRRIQKVFVVVTQEDDNAELLLAEFGDQVHVLPLAGKERVNTVANALNYLLEHAVVSETDWVLVHDAARPGLPLSCLSALIDQASQHPVGGFLALPIADTLKQTEMLESGDVVSGQTVSRHNLWAAQTPQMFRCQALSLALNECLYKGAAITDEAGAIEVMGMRPLIVRGSLANIKVTVASDLPVVQAFMGARIE